MEVPVPRWCLLSKSTNAHGTTYFTLACNSRYADDDDYRELVRVLEDRFGAVEQVPLIGPYSTHMHFHVGGFCLGVILDDPGELPVYAMHELGRPAMEPFIHRLLTVLNQVGVVTNGD
jgi:hypothetical protein